jgi:glycosyltransferase involved in cell wall biosynthesis
MTHAAITQPNDPAVSDPAPIASGKRRLEGKRAAMVTYSLYPGDPRPRRAVDALVGEGMHVDLLCLGSENSSRRERLNGVNVYRIALKHRRGGKLAYAYQYAVFILISSAIFAFRSLTRRYDLVYVHNMPDILVLCSLVPKALGAKVILDMHDPMPELMTTIFNLDKDSFSVRLIGRFEKWSMARANFVVAVNVACKRIFATRSCPPEKIGVVMNSPDGAIFPYRPPQSHSSTNQSPDKPFVILYHGSLVERNGLDLAVEALARVRKSIPTAELRVFGLSTPFFERVMESAHSRNLDEAIRYLGHKRLEELVQEIEQCDVGVIPNHRNAFTEINTPTRIFEYLALGKPVITPSTQGIQDYFRKESLLFFEPGNADDLARQIEYVYLHPGEVRDIVEKGQEVYLSHRWEHERASLLGFVSELMCGKGGPD